MCAVLSTTCPHCGYVNTRYAGVVWGDEVPPAGALSLCKECLEPAIFEYASGGLCLRLPTAAERAAVEAIPEFDRIRLCMLLAKQMLQRDL
jgi:hypothetical protein